MFIWFTSSAWFLDNVVLLCKNCPETGIAGGGGAMVWTGNCTGLEGDMLRTGCCCWNTSCLAPTNCWFDVTVVVVVCGITWVLTADPEETTAGGLTTWAFVVEPCTSRLVKLTPETGETFRTYRTSPTCLDVIVLTGLCCWVTVVVLPTVLFTRCSSCGRWITCLALNKYLLLHRNVI